MPRARKKSLSASTSLRVSREGSEESSAAEDAPRTKGSRLESSSPNLRPRAAMASPPAPGVSPLRVSARSKITDYFMTSPSSGPTIEVRPDSPPMPILLPEVNSSPTPRLHGNVSAPPRRSDDQASDRSEGDSGKENDEDHEWRRANSPNNTHRLKLANVSKNGDENSRVMTRSQLRSKMPFLSLANETTRLNPSTPPPSPSKLGPTLNAASPPTPHKIQLLEGKTSTNGGSSGSSSGPNTPPSCPAANGAGSNTTTIKKPSSISANALQTLRLTLSPKKNNIISNQEANATTAPLPAPPTPLGTANSSSVTMGNYISTNLPLGPKLRQTTDGGSSSVKSDLSASRVTPSNGSRRPTNSKGAKAAAAAANSSHKVTEYFPIRRSCRKSKTTLQKEHLEEIEHHLLADNDEDCDVDVEVFPEKGRGVVALRDFEKGEFVVEYAGDLIEIGCAKERENKYSLDLSTGCYMYYFKYNNHNYCIDATGESGRLGRLVNHSRLNSNLQTKVISFKGQPRLILVARTNIQTGTELLYDYGDRSKESLVAHPWLAY
eukprot:maker-scaffold504_size153273-snap-gene-0.13 protein:Tk10467 transcript:maker-scaffold504_size153273-snap-gene-0.13-mRNA-1 annotation:"hypothetical protein TcasGA2_TC015766"